MGSATECGQGNEDQPPGAVPAEVEAPAGARSSQDWADGHSTLARDGPPTDSPKSNVITAQPTSACDLGLPPPPSERSFTGTRSPFITMVSDVYSPRSDGQLTPETVQMRRASKSRSGTPPTPTTPLAPRPISIVAKDGLAFALPAPTPVAAKESVPTPVEERAYVEPVTVSHVGDSVELQIAGRRFSFNGGDLGLNLQPDGAGGIHVAFSRTPAVTPAANPKLGPDGPERMPVGPQRELFSDRGVVAEYHEVAPEVPERPSRPQQFEV